MGDVKLQNLSDQEFVYLKKRVENADWDIKWNARKSSDPHLINNTLDILEILCNGNFSVDLVQKLNQNFFKIKTNNKSSNQT